MSTQSAKQDSVFPYTAPPVGLSWATPTAKQRALMTEWVNQQLDNKLSEDIAHANSADAVKSFVDETTRRQAEAAIVEAIKTKDLVQLSKLQEAHPTLAPLIQSLGGKKGVGRPKGWRPGLQQRQMSQTEILVAASEQVDLVHEIWRSGFGRWKRAREDRPSAIEIVVGRFRDMGIALSEDALAKWRKDHPKVLRR